MCRFLTFIFTILTTLNIITQVSYAKLTVGTSLAPSSQVLEGNLLAIQEQTRMAIICLILLLVVILVAWLYRVQVSKKRRFRTKRSRKA